MGCAECERLGSTGDWHRRPFDATDRADTAAEALMINASRLYDEQLHLLVSKNQDYSPLNISMSPFGVMQGLMTRISDKYWRAINLLEKGTEANHEGLEDTFRDLMGYSAISVLCWRGEWPGVGRGGVRR